LIFDLKRSPPDRDLAHHLEFTGIRNLPQVGVFRGYAAVLDEIEQTTLLPFKLGHC
jgi:hypothetical protein